MDIAAYIFAVAAVGGAVMAAMRLQGRELPPLWLALLHGIIAAAGLVTLIYALVRSASVPTTAIVALAGFILAALGGFTLFLFFHLKKKALPIPLVLGHGAVAVISFIILLIGLFKL